jgi:tripartite-type tricarboxylate transporter receptor subunit TctC
MSASRSGCWRGLLLAGLLLAPLAAVRAADSGDFYRGKQIHLYISTGPGGGYDAYARTLARYMGNHIAGNPSLVPQNMPGAGGLRATGFLYNTAARDGTSLALVHGSMTTADLLTPDGANFKPVNFAYIGNIDGEPGFCVAWKSSPVKRVEDLKTHEFAVGSTGAGAGLDIHPRVLNKVYGTHMRVVAGYEAGNDVALAMERGEVDGRCSWPISAISVMRPQWLADHDITLLVQFGIEKNPHYPHVPSILELVSDADTRSALELILAERQLLRPVMAPPETPEDKVAILRSAFLATVADPGFLAECEKQGLGVTPMAGDKVQALVAHVHETAPRIVKLATELIAE